MNILSTSFKGLYVLETNNFKDGRGQFQKIFNFEYFKEHNLETDFKEIYFSINHKGVIRGMHFQLPPFDHVKLVYVSSGRILDVVVDLRKESPTYGSHFCIELSSQDGRFLYIPRGFGHGFASLEENTIVNYAQTTCYAANSDSGIRADSCGIKWPFENPIISDRDLTFESLDHFNSPF